MSSKRKSLADRIAELANPTPKDVDPERAEQGFEEPLLDEYNADEDASAPTAKYQKAAVRPLLRAEPQMGAAYRGKRVSRSAATRGGGILRGDFASDDGDNSNDVDDGDDDDEDGSDSDYNNAQLPGLDIEFEDADMVSDSSSDDQDTENRYQLDNIAATGDDDDYEDDDGGDGDDDEDGTPRRRQPSNSSASSARKLADSLQQELDDDDDDDDDDDLGDSDDDDMDEDASLEEEEDSDEQENAVSTGLGRAVGQNTIEAQKAQDTKSQRMLWDAFLDMRMKLQAPLELANKLPVTSARTLLRDANPDGVDEVSHACHIELQELIHELLDMQTLLIEQNPETRRSARPVEPLKLPSDSSTRKRSRADITRNGGGDDFIDREQDSSSAPMDLTDLWDSIDAHTHRLDGYMDETIDKWHTKTLYSAGLNMNKLKAINASLSRQIAQSWDQSRAKLVTRSQLRRDAFAPLGKRLATEQSTSGGDVNHAFIDDADDQDGGVSGGSKSGNGGRRQHPTEPEIFDDGDFYQTLLKQLIESGLSETADPVEMSRQWLQVKSATRKMHRADVDRRASKGRKLRYTEHQQLLSFMAPQTARYKQADSVQASQLSLTIFGLRPDPQQPSATAASG